MSWQLPVTPQHSSAPLTPEQLNPPAPVSSDGPRASIAPLRARIDACRPCEHVAHGGQTCAACDLRCTHPLAAERPPLLADPGSVCPDNRWPTTL